MINKTENPVAWATLMFELEDAQEHLQELMNEMTKNMDFDETDFQIQIGHIYAHLNRAWNTRNEAEVSSGKLQVNSQWPTDLELT